MPVELAYRPGVEVNRVTLPEVRNPVVLACQIPSQLPEELVVDRALTVWEPNPMDNRIVVPIYDRRGNKIKDGVVDQWDGIRTTVFHTAEHTLEVADFSHKGNDREKQEDNTRVCEIYLENCTEQLFIVADGLGGHNTPEIASAFVIYMFPSVYTRFRTQGLAPDEALGATIVELHKRLLVLGLNLPRDPSLDPLASTISAGVISGQKLYTASAGDSRAYYAREGVMHQVTRDQTPLFDAYSNGTLSEREFYINDNRNKIRSCLGGNEQIEVLLYEPVELKEGDKILLCSDGLWGASGKLPRYEFGQHAKPIGYVGGNAALGFYLQRDTAAHSANDLTRLALLCSKEDPYVYRKMIPDNISGIVIFVNAQTPTPETRIILPPEGSTSYGPLVEIRDKFLREHSVAGAMLLECALEDKDALTTIQGQQEPNEATGIVDELINFVTDMRVRVPRIDIHGNIKLVDATVIVSDKNSEDIEVSITRNGSVFEDRAFPREQIQRLNPISFNRLNFASGSFYEDLYHLLERRGGIFWQDKYLSVEKAYQQMHYLVYQYVRLALLPENSMKQSKMGELNELMNKFPSFVSNVLRLRVEHEVRVIKKRNAFKTGYNNAGNMVTTTETGGGRLIYSQSNLESEK